jgi:hypothetical protein
LLLIVEGEVVEVAERQLKGVGATDVFEGHASEELVCRFCEGEVAYWYIL